MSRKLHLPIAVVAILALANIGAATLVCINDAWETNSSIFQLIKAYTEDYVSISLLVVCQLDVSFFTLLFMSLLCVFVKPLDLQRLLILAFGIVHLVIATPVLYIRFQGGFDRLFGVFPLRNLYG